MRGRMSGSFATAAVAAMAGLALGGATIARAQDKSAPLSKIERLNRAPVSKEILRVKLPRPATVKLANGLTVLLLEDHKLPTVAFTMWIRPGQLADPKDLPGLASFTADMLREGTDRRTSEQIATEVDSLGATLAADSRFGASFTTVNASGLIDNAAQILDLMSDVVLHATFPESELAKFKQRQAASLEDRLSNPNFLGQQAFRRVLYGEGPLAVTSPTKESIEKATQADLKRFHDEHYTPGNTLLGVTGDFKTGEMRALVEKHFGGWAGKAEPAEKVATASAQPTKITLVDRPNSVQTFIILGDRGIRRNDPDYYAVDLMNQIVGASAQSRLFLDLREEHSLTYGAYSRFNADVYPGDWFAFSPVRTSVTDEAMARFTYEVKKINDEPVPANELDDARRAMVAGFALSLESPATVIGDWLAVQHYGLAEDYWDKYPDRIAAVDDAAVQRVAKKYVDPEHMQWVCVGDRAKIQDALAKYGTVNVVDVTGQPEK